ncbi:MAG: type I restriction enzyme HsdR N-terminal domain-containing protein [Muribaculaceae bacterium]|nr:type I restriction enzyme HsdR N-terminal domain-containing protein [Muribaculaceae bacterium]
MNLPSFEYELSQREDGVTRIYDRLRKKFVALTPEEWVRQHFVNYLISERGYPGGLMANEVSLKLNSTARRCDTLVYSRTGKPVAVIEYKAPSIAVTQAVFDQIARYNSVIGAAYLMVSNGLSHYCCRYDEKSEGYVFLRDIPRYEEL